MNPPLYDMRDGQPVMDTLYTRCPSCGVAAPAGSLSIGVTGDGRFDPDEPLLVSCLPAEHRYTITTAALFPATPR